MNTARPSDPEVWARLQAICAALPATSEKISHAELAWSVGTGKKTRQFATTWDHHHGHPHNAVLFAAPPGAQAQLVDAEPTRYFRPPYYGGRGWVGINLDVPGDPVDWDLVELHLTDAHSLMQG